MQNLCSEKHEKFQKSEYMFEISIDKQIYVRYNININIRSGEKKMKNHNIKLDYITIFSTVLLLSILILLSVFIISNKADAQGNKSRIKLVKTIEIQEGDTLWNIASQYKSDEYSDIRVYINEIKKSNNIYSDEIYSGNYIIVPYYCDAAN